MLADLRRRKTLLFLKGKHKLTCMENALFIIGMRDSTRRYLIDEEQGRIMDESLGTLTHEVIRGNTDMSSEVSGRIDAITPIAGNYFSSKLIWIVLFLR